jgi:hypothetical protein
MKSSDLEKAFSGLHEADANMKRLAKSASHAARMGAINSFIASANAALDALDRAVSSSLDAADLETDSLKKRLAAEAANCPAPAYADSTQARIAQLQSEIDRLRAQEATNFFDERKGK